MSESGKTIVFCADGTWNGPGQDDHHDGVPDATNVLKLFTALRGQTSSASLRLKDEQEKTLLDGAGETLQIAKYLHGVGDSRNPITKVLGGVFGEGFIARVVRGYTFVSRNYEPGDRIVLLGFSRGAYTARALGGMIVSMGLLDRETLFSDGVYDAEGAYRKGVAVWSRYRRQAGKASTLLGYLEEFRAAPLDLERQVWDVPVHAIAVWDTVGSMGVPVYDERDHERVDVFKFADQKLSDRVGWGLHAVSVDEMRRDFAPTLWEARDQIKQVWFAGAHADVGGGYTETELSDLALAWMVRELAALDVEFSGSWPRPVGQPTGASHSPWAEAPFNLLDPVPRAHPGNALFHRSVGERLAALPEYRPASLRPFLREGALPAQYLVN